MPMILEMLTLTKTELGFIETERKQTDRSK